MEIGVEEPKGLNLVHSTAVYFLIGKEHKISISWNSRSQSLSWDSEAVQLPERRRKSWFCGTLTLRRVQTTELQVHPAKKYKIEKGKVISESLTLRRASRYVILRTGMA